ncbi:hypothetical protein yc1106_09520 [Curvularia clavata]|uniref:Uncharacterized protein n=1 Tax=Curvularia clavata TaxID=95742 RepID=A0A9Q8ZHN9_CURCL|nr:hypothetical protein yc1106_09520 [Curvularia clavata]
MISDLVVRYPAHHVTPPASPERRIRFEQPRTICCGIFDTLGGQLDDYGAKLLQALVSDDELVLQLMLSPTALTPTTERKQPRDGTKFLGVIIYGPRRRLGDVAEFMAEASCYLDDPVDCDRNVPYMNPQCLFSLHEQPPMTLELSQPQRTHMDDFSRPSLDFLSGFETADDIKLSGNPTALRTELKLSTSGPLWLGGLLADEMGLGKTLSMIALIASDQDRTLRNDLLMSHPVSETSIHSTLIVLPPSCNVFNVWESQLERHLHKGKLKWCRHHGKNKFRLRDRQSQPDVVFTTYPTIEREYRNRAESEDSVFFHHWRRIILDEAHIIRNHNTSTAQAVTALRATSRWAVSGTPIQNSLLDLHSLFKFLHFAPYDDPKAFDDDITHVWRVKSIDQAAEVFKKLLSSVMLRRTKAVLDLPSREDKLIRVPFSREEKEHYRRIEQPVADMLDCIPENGTHTNGTWMSVIQQINKLRLFCNLGLTAPSPSGCTPNPDSIDEKTLTPSADLSPYSIESDSISALPSKISALLSQIRLYPDEKHVVFSCWTSSLDMVEKAFRCDPNRIIQSVRIDGNVPLKNRDYAIQQLHNDPSMRVILVTIACGACGLDLTAASRAHLLEPQWNPSLEDQALARVHRLGQTRPVRTIRYVMDDSFEEYILDVQDRKKLLVTTLLSNESSLENLRKLIHRKKEDQIGS